jgi:hypothetical protein
LSHFDSRNIGIIGLIIVFSFLSNIVAPIATAKLKASSSIPFSSIVSNLQGKYRLKSSTDRVAKYEIPGDFFAAFESIEVAKGAKPNPVHYEKIPFDLTIKSLGAGEILLTAEQRIIFGWLEKSAVSTALASRLMQMMELIAR